MYETLNKTERLEKLKSDLLEWKGKFSTHQRCDIAKALDLHPRVLDNYLNGFGKAITTCEAILNHLSTHYPDRVPKTLEA